MTNQNININPQDLISPYLFDVYVSTEADLIFFGSKNLEYLKRLWRSVERDLSKQVKKAQADIDLLAGKTPEDIRAMAAQYENPDFPRIGMVKIWRDDYLEPLDDASINRKRGATTFNVCGWCEHCDGGPLRHNCCITAYCQFMPRPLDDYTTKNCRFDTPCALAHGTQELLDACVEHLKARKAALIAKKQRAGAYASYLTEVMKKAEEKPYFAPCRPHDWFNIGDNVKLFLSTFDGVLPDKANTFISAKVINCRRHHDGCVAACADELLHSDKYCDGYGVELGAGHPNILQDWEFAYLKEHPDYLKVWVHCAKAQLRDFDSERFTKALGKSRVFDSKLLTKLLKKARVFDFMF